MLLLKWFLSGTVRHAMEMRRHVTNILRAQEDLLKPEAIAAVTAATDDLHLAAATGDKKAITAKMTALEEVANKWLRPYPNATWRENVEVFLVAIAVAIGIRTFFIQPFKIPTGSMQPTLYGITSENLIGRTDFKMPGFLPSIYESWVKGVSYFHVVAKSDGEIHHVGPVKKLLLFNLSQSFYVGNQEYTIWFPPDGLVSPNQTERSLVYEGLPVKAGQDILYARVVTGDFLFVDRVTYNFRPPRRGDIVVFQTTHIRNAFVPTNQFYIKRLVGLSKETMSITPDRHLVINGEKLTASTPRFERLYSFSHGYSGHKPIGYFERGQTYEVPENNLVVMGDNTENSLDSRYWGGFPREDVIGREWFVFWPISDRFGWGYR